jgi:thiol:disulfide interchange protein DsbC
MFRQLITSALVTGLMTVPVLAGSSAEGADVDTIKATLGADFPKIRIVDIQPSPIPALYEVYTGKAIFYTDTSGKYLIDGEMIDGRTHARLTPKRVDERNRIDFTSLPFDLAIKVVKGNGSRKFAIFTDPDCPYCRKFEEEMRPVTDVTMYVFLFPLKIHPGADKHSRDIWCSEDRSAAWTAYLSDKTQVPKEAASNCTNDPVAELAQLAFKLNISATPTVYFVNGERDTGVVAEDLQTRLAESTEPWGSCKAESESASGRGNARGQGCG